jgi:valyl-tRNA synthetase
MQTVYKKISTFVRILQGNLPEKEVLKAIEGQKLDFPEGIPRCGADALRFGLLAYTVQGRDINLDIARVAGYRMFCNKLWQATRFALMNLGPDFSPSSADMERAVISDPMLAPRDKWILEKLNQAVVATNKAFAEYVFGDACTAIYNFWLYHLCDIYLETLKPVMYGSDEAAKLISRQVLWICLDNGLRMLHPIMPFVTEELWQHLPGRSIMHPQETIMLARYPQDDLGYSFPGCEESMTIVSDLAKAVRYSTGSYNINKQVATYVRSSSPIVQAVMSSQNSDICALAKASSCTLLEGDIPKNCALQVVDGSTEVIVSLEGFIDPVVEVANQEKKLAAKLQYLEGLISKTTVADYESKVPESVREKDKAKIDETQVEVEAIRSVLESFKKML